MLNALFCNKASFSYMYMFLFRIKKYKEISKRAEQKRELREREMTSSTQVTNGDVIDAELYQCQHCEAAFDSASLLNIHALTHSVDGDALQNMEHGEILVEILI